VAVCHEAAMASLSDQIEAQTVYGSHFEKALQIVKPQVGEILVKFYEDYHKTRDVVAV
jgi:SpoVK/Ycf46/Vps4 family AAA+-type ATPase